jgi:xylulokinase
MPNYYLGFDSGTQSVKVAVHDDQMRCIASSSHPTTLTYPHPGWVDMDVDEYLALTIQGMADCSAQIRAAGLDPANVRAIMGDGIICGIAGVDAQGRAITPYVNYLDSRTAEDEALINSWNLDIWGRETGNPAAKCMFPALFARWFMEHVPGTCSPPCSPAGLWNTCPASANVAPSSCTTPPTSSPTWPAFPPTTCSSTGAL